MTQVVIKIHADDEYRTLEDAVGDGFTFITGNRRSQHHYNGEDLEDAFPEVGRWFPLHVYEHGQVLYSLQSDPRVPGSDCPWDGVSGGAMIGLHKDAGWNMDKAEDIARGLASDITDWSNGAFYGYTIEDTDDNEIDACWGFLGYENVESSAKEAAKDYEIIQIGGV